jgi:hypothetical protein
MKFPDPDKGESFLTLKENIQIWATLIGVNLLFWGSLYGVYKWLL